MREIKFRALSSSKKQWVYGFYSPVNVPILGTLGHCINEGGYKAVDILIYSLGQFTGLKDKNGMDIYEGDILKTLQDSFGDFIKNPSVTFEDGAFILVGSKNQYEYMHYYESDTELEIIGNIYENPEML